MPSNVIGPIRSCIQCRNKLEQKSLKRLQFIESKIIGFSGSGRSFYICQECKEKPGTIKHIKSRCKVSKDDFIEFEQQLREILSNG